jgi:signal transduction histidine kinase
MIAIPVVLCVLFATVMNLAMIGIFGSFGGRSLDDERFYQAKRSIAALDGTVRDADELFRAVDGIAKSNENEHIAIFVYKDGQPLGAPALDTPLLPVALEKTGTHTLILDHTALFAQTVGEYHIILMDTNYYLSDDTSYRSYVAMGFGMLILIVAIIVVTNRILTRFMVKSIITPLDTLSYGVEQIKSGNLPFRLDYLGKDEFTPVCVAFNEMAGRLQNSEEARQQDENSRRELIAGISHDLRTPLTSVKAYIEGLEKGVAVTPEQQKKYLDTIKTKTADLENIINKLFMFAKLDTSDFPVRLERVNIGSELTKILNGLSEEYKDKGLTLRITRPLPDAFANIDRTLLQNVILNVLENSAKYKTAETVAVSVSCRIENGYAKIRLADDGRGVPDNILDKLFDVFFRADPSRGKTGNGLGLAISAKIIRRMNGGIVAESVDGGGLAITIALPLAAGGDETA